MQNEFDQSTSNKGGIRQAATDNVSSNAINDGFSAANEPVGNRS